MIDCTEWMRQLSGRGETPSGLLDYLISLMGWQACDRLLATVKTHKKTTRRWQGGKVGIYLEQRSGKAIYLNTDEILLADYYPASDGSPSRLNIFFKGSETMKVFIDRQADMLMRSFKDSWDVEIIREGDHFDGSDLILCEPEPELSQS